MLSLAFFQHFSAARAGKPAVTHGNLTADDDRFDTFITPVRVNKIGMGTHFLP